MHTHTNTLIPCKHSNDKRRDTFRLLQEEYFEVEKKHIADFQPLPIFTLDKQSNIEVSREDYTSKSQDMAGESKDQI